MRGPAVMLKTERLVLRPARQSDLGDINAFMSDARAMRYWSTAPHPDLAGACRSLAEAGLAPETLPEDNRLLTAMLVMMRLIAPDTLLPTRVARDLLAEVTGYPDWDALLEAQSEARARIKKYWEKTRDA